MQPGVMPAPVNLRRLAWALALVPMVPAMSGIITNILGDAFSASGLDEFRVWNAVELVLAVAGALLIFRTAVVWTLGRGVLAAIINLVPFVQVAFNQPMWDPTSCGSDYVLKVAQSQLGIAVWVWLAVWAWWGCEKWMSAAPASVGPGPQRRFPMMSAERRIAACLGVLPFSFAVFFIAYVAWEDLTGQSSEWCTIVGYLVSALLMTGAWQFIWRGCVAWTPRVVKRTLALWAVLLAAPIALTLTRPLGFASGNAWLETAIWMTPVIGWGLWMGGTMLFWPFKSAALGLDPPAPRCLNCGYNLTGLYATRCPECGNQPTLDELWAQRSDGIQAWHRFPAGEGAGAAVTP